MHCPNYRDLHLSNASYLESKEVSSGKQLDWHSLKKHLTSNFSDILYDTHAINVYDNLHKVAMSQQLCICTGCKIFTIVFTTQAI